MPRTFGNPRSTVISISLVRRTDTAMDPEHTDHTLPVDPRSDAATLPAEKVNQRLSLLAWESVADQEE
ncbi:hypothetical protein GTS_18290 [Gandjariella thermophila]|uniref:Uncharacterized protein n=1 Tax=Gandjariella thermophila TaxID=1931992 RepID=A0A4D4J6Q8_9PSEU|nr:hypothetical protein GTS_18290 [Gandjariella thermophila]